MLVSYNWLKEYVDIEQSAEELAEIITRAGIEIGGVEPTNKGVSGVVVAYVESCEAHPDSDHLHVCQVTTDGETSIQVVCGAPNIAAGQKVMFAQVGAKLPGIEIKAAKLRGQVSNGMICSMQEIGLPEELVYAGDKDGIRVLPEDAPLGVDVMEYLGLNDFILDVDLTPNRSDCLSVHNIAKEVGALLEKPVRPIEAPTLEGDEVAERMQVRIENPTLCHRFTGTMVQGAVVGRSPQWMEHRLQCAGIRPISNLVDITNYVMLELGQPLHAYDYHQIADKQIVVRNARQDETIVTLDSQERALTEEMLLICDGKRAVGIAGVMGGENTEITDTTQDVFIESAYFQSTNVRRTSVALGLRSEASMRFEKNINIETTALAGWRAADLMVKTAGASLVAGQIDEYPTKHEPIVVSLMYQYVNDLLGTDIEFKEMRRILIRLGFKVIKEDDDSIEVQVPAHRPDISIREDLVEEIARLYGYDNIPETLPFGATNPGVLTPRQRLVDQIKSSLVGLGLSEIMTYSFISKKHSDLLRYAENDVRRNQIALANPLSEDMSVMRSSLVPSMMEAIVNNVKRQAQQLALFECSTVFAADHALDQQHLANEKQHLVIGLLGGTSKDWKGSQKAYDFFYLKGLIESLLKDLRIDNWQVKAKKDDPTWHPGRTASLFVNEKCCGIFGEIHPSVLKNYGLKSTVYMAEIDLEDILAAGIKVPFFNELSSYPAVSRDLAVVVDKNHEVGTLKDIIMSSKPENLLTIEVFDVYSGEQLGQNKVSIAMSLVFQSSTQTLTDEMVQKEMDKILKALTEQAGAQLRA